MDQVQPLTGLEIYDWVVGAYLVAYLLYAAHAFIWRGKGFSYICTAALTLALAGHTVFIVQRALFYQAQYQGFVLPAVNMFEAISFFAWLIVIIYLVCEHWLFKSRAFGVFGLLIPLASMFYTARSMNGDPRDMMPALKSYWLVFHVTAMFISYAAFALAFAFALMYLLRAYGLKSLETIDKRFTHRYLDEMSAKLTLFGMPILTIGIFLGAVWADSAWGRYWGWDPKEVWALITWLVYLIWIHFRLQRGWIGFKSALLNFIGFISVLITFMGVNLLDKAFGLNSIHAYAEGGASFFLAILGLAVFIPLVMFFMPRPKQDPIGRDKQVLKDEQAGTSAGGASGPEEEVKAQKGPFDYLWDWLNSLPVAIAVMVILAILCAVGTVIPQEHLAQGPPAMFQADLVARYGEFRAGIITALGFHHVYFTVYFFLLLVWLSVSAVVCNYTRIKKTIKLFKSPNVVRPDAFYESSSALSPVAGVGGDRVEEAVAELKRNRYRVVRIERDGATHIFADRGMAKQWGLVVLHLSIVVLIFGAAFGKVTGSEGSVFIGDGQEKTLVLDRNEGKHRLIQGITSRLAPLSYGIKLHGFRIDYDKRLIETMPMVHGMISDEVREYNSYFIKDFVSDVEIEHKGKSIRREAKVNHPVTIGGLNVYQSGYEQRGYAKVDVDGAGSTALIMSGAYYLLTADGLSLLESTQPGEQIGNRAYRFAPVKAGKLFVGGEEQGSIPPMVSMQVYDLMSTQLIDNVILTTDRPYEFTADGHAVRMEMDNRVDNYSVFSYKRDPGIPVLYIGWIAMIIGIVLAIYIPYGRLWLRVRDGEARLAASGVSVQGFSPLTTKIHDMLGKS